jgi:hypothetical protein
MMRTRSAKARHADKQKNNRRSAIDAAAGWRDSNRSTAPALAAG